MDPMDIINRIETGQLKTVTSEIDLNTLEWVPHATFKGVFLKHLVTASHTKGLLSCHLVKIEPNSEIGYHVHENNLESHEVIFGRGVLYIDNKNYHYHPGDIGIMPPNIQHRVCALEDGLILLAKFTSALV